MTKPDEKAIAAPAIRGLRRPQAANGIAATLYPNAHKRLPRMVFRVLRARLMAVATTRRSSRTMMRSAALSATSVPEPTARPRSALTSAGPSLIPSPTMATAWPSVWSRRMSPTLSAGSAPATMSEIPIDVATERAVTSLSPVSRMQCKPSAWSSRTASVAVGRTESARAKAPITRPSRLVFCSTPTPRTDRSVPREPPPAKYPAAPVVR